MFFDIKENLAGEKNCENLPTVKCSLPWQTQNEWFQERFSKNLIFVVGKNLWNLK